MTPRVTHCPHCGTSFRVTQVQMQAANGSVRCGSCLQVFNARDYLNATDPSATNKKPATAPASTPQNKDTPQKTAPDNQRTDTRHTESLSETPSPHFSTHSEDNEPAFTSQTSDSASTATTAFKDEPDSQYEMQAALDQLDQENINFPNNKPNNESNKKHWKKSLYWGLAALFFAVLLIIQYGWFQRNTLSLNPDLRPIYQWGCKIATCTLPPMVDIGAIKSLQLLVRSHPDASNALLVDTVIINNASHPQPYPVLNLSFTDINGNLVANRKFTSREYLGGELTGSKEMAVSQPIRLSLEIIDPGQDAVNYQLSFSPEMTP